MQMGMLYWLVCEVAMLLDELLGKKEESTLILPPHFGNRNNDQDREKARKDLKHPQKAGQESHQACVPSSHEILSQNSMNFDVA